MRGSFTSGVPPAPSVTRLTGRVGPGRKISLRRGTVRVRSLAAGRYKITVRDVTRADNFHLSGPGVNKKASIRGRKKVTWAVTLRKGTYRYRSDAHKRLGGKFVVFQKPTP
jgi:hypothetical protein